MKPLMRGFYGAGASSVKWRIVVLRSICRSGFARRGRDRRGYRGMRSCPILYLRPCATCAVLPPSVCDHSLEVQVSAVFVVLKVCHDSGCTG